MATPPLAGTLEPGGFYVDAQTREAWFGVPLAQDPVGAKLIADIVGAQAALASTSAADRAYTDAQVASRALISHSHAISDIVGLAESLAALGLIVQSGMIMLWKGSIASIPAGWAICDGTNGTPDFRNKFVLGAGGAFAMGSAGGSQVLNATTTPAGAHSHGGATAPTTLSIAQLPTHSHGLSDLGHTHGFALIAEAAGAHAHVSGQGAAGLPANSAQRYGGVETALPAAYATGLTSTVGALSSTVGAHSHLVSGQLDLASSNMTVAAVGADAGHSHGLAAAPDHTHTLAVNFLPPYVVHPYIMKL